jgi:hypothetical protein
MDLVLNLPSIFLTGNTRRLTTLQLIKIKITLKKPIKICAWQVLGGFLLAIFAA